MEMEKVKIAGVEHWHLYTELWTGSWTNNQEKQVSFDGQSCQHRLLVKRVNKERGNDIFKLCWETDFNLLVLWLLSTAVHWAERWQIWCWYGSLNYFINACKEETGAICWEYLQGLFVKIQFLHRYNP